MMVWINLYKEFDGEITALAYLSKEDAAEDSECDEFVETIVREI